MTTNEQLKLIEGEFLHDEAKEILTNIFTAKINFHRSKNFSSQERFGTVDERAMERIPALEKEMEKLEKILSEADTQNKKLIISSDINISLSND